jgi:hypothetical protein
MVPVLTLLNVKWVDAVCKISSESPGPLCVCGLEPEGGLDGNTGARPCAFHSFPTPVLLLLFVMVFYLTSSLPIL